MMLQKRQNDLKLFIEAGLLVKDKKHTNIEGQTIIANIASKLSSNLTLENKAKLSKTIFHLNNERVTGFTDAEGHFSFTIVPSKSNLNHTSVNFNFVITQEKSEIKFLNDLVKFFGCGNVFTDEKGGGRYVVSNKKDLANKIIPFFDSNELQTIKQISFLRFKKALNICINNKPLSNIEELNSILSDNTGKRPKKNKIVI